MIEARCSESLIRADEMRQDETRLFRSSVYARNFKKWAWCLSMRFHFNHTHRSKGCLGQSLAQEEMCVRDNACTGLGKAGDDGLGLGRESKLECC